MFGRSSNRRAQRQSGLTLIELIIFIVIVSVALTGVLLVLNTTVKSSADPLVRKQMLAIAEGVMEEVRMQPFTWCDPNDPQAATATSAASCTSAADDQLTTAPGTGSTSGGAETRGSTTAPFDNVADYNGAVITTNIAGANLPAGYSADVTVAQDALGPAANPVPSSASLRITVVVSHGSERLTLDGYRTRYAPNSLP